MNTQSLLLAGLICLAVANESAIEHPTDDMTYALTLLMFGGPALYIATTIWYVWAAPPSYHRDVQVLVIGNYC